MASTTLYNLDVNDVVLNLEVFECSLKRAIDDASVHETRRKFLKSCLRRTQKKLAISRRLHLGFDEGLIASTAPETINPLDFINNDLPSAINSAQPEPPEPFDIVDNSPPLPSKHPVIALTDRVPPASTLEDPNDDKRGQQQRQ